MRVRPGVLVAMVAAFAVPAASAPAANQTVTLDSSNTFKPAAVTVNPGQTVTWNNTGGIHNVHFDDGSYVQPASPQFAPWTVSRTFGTAGTFRYYCEVHGGPGGVGMSGTVTVNSGYPRPKGATPVLTSLAVAYKPCASANRTHGPPLASPSCNPPAQESSFLTVGTLDANGQAANAAGAVRLDSKVSSPEDVRIVASITDVRNQGTLTDYGGELQAKPTLPYDEPATTVDVNFPVTIPCATTTDTTIGSTCSVTTSANAVLAGAVNDAVRTIWQLGQVQVFDGGSDGVASTSGNTLFMNEGIFIP